MCAVKERFVEKPNLPESKVTTAAVSGAYPEILEALKAHGIRCVTTEFDTRLRTDRVPCRYADVSFG